MVEWSSAPCMVFLLCLTTATSLRVHLKPLFSDAITSSGIPTVSESHLPSKTVSNQVLSG